MAVIDSEKTTFELPATESGTLTKILHQAGDTVSVGTVIAHIEPGGGADKPKPAETKTVGQSKPEAKRPTPAESETKTEPSAAETRRTQPRAKERTPAHAETKEGGTRRIQETRLKGTWRKGDCSRQCRRGSRTRPQSRSEATRHETEALCRTGKRRSFR